MAAIPTNERTLAALVCELPAVQPQHRPQVGALRDGNSERHLPHLETINPANNDVLIVNADSCGKARIVKKVPDHLRPAEVLLTTTYYTTTQLTIISVVCVSICIKSLYIVFLPSSDYLLDTMPTFAPDRPPPPILIALHRRLSLTSNLTLRRADGTWIPVRPSLISRDCRESNDRLQEVRPRPRWCTQLSGRDRAAVRQGLPDGSEVIVAQPRGHWSEIAWYLCSKGITPFLDIGSGLPTAENTVHEVAERAIPAVPFVFVDSRGD